MLRIRRASQQVLRAKDDDSEVARGGGIRRGPGEHLLVAVVELQRHKVEEHEEDKGDGGDLQYGSRTAPPHAMGADEEECLCPVSPFRRPVARELVCEAAHGEATGGGEGRFDIRVQGEERERGQRERYRRLQCTNMRRDRYNKSVGSRPLGVYRIKATCSMGSQGGSAWGRSLDSAH